MGRMVSIWSPVEKTGKTVLTYLLAYKLSELTGYKPRILICCANGKTGNLRNIFTSAPPLVEMEDIVNIGAVSTGDRLNLYGMFASHKNIYFIGSSRSGPAFVNRYSEAYRNLAREFKGVFDLVLVDTSSEWSSENILGRLMLEESDWIVNMLPQNPLLLQNRIFKTGKEAAWVVNQYIDAEPTQDELESIYGVEPLFMLPYCDKLADFHKKRTLNSYVYQESGFNEVLDNIAGVLANRLGFMKLEPKPKPVVRKPRKVLAALLEVIS